MKKPEAMRHADEWNAIADAEVRMKAIDAAAGHNTSCNDNRISCYRKVAESYRLEAQTGIPHCSSCLKPTSSAHTCF